MTHQAIRIGVIHVVQACMLVAVLVGCGGDQKAAKRPFSPSSSAVPPPPNFSLPEKLLISLAKKGTVFGHIGSAAGLPDTLDAEAAGDELERRGLVRHFGRRPIEPGTFLTVEEHKRYAREFAASGYEITEAGRRLVALPGGIRGGGEQWVKDLGPQVPVLLKRAQDLGFRFLPGQRPLPNAKGHIPTTMEWARKLSADDVKVLKGEAPYSEKVPNVDEGFTQADMKDPKRVPCVSV